MSDDEQEETSIVVPLLDLQSNKSEERRLIVAPDNATSFLLFELTHPRYETAALYHIGEERVCEVLQKTMEERACFNNNSVVNPTSLILLSPIHPLFLLLPVIEDIEMPAFKLKDLVEHSQHAAMSRLVEMSAVRKAMEQTFDTKDDLYVLNEQKLSDWLQKRFDLLLQRLQADRSLLDTKAQEANIKATAFEIFSEFLTPKSAKMLRKAWTIPAVVDTNFETNLKRLPDASIKKVEVKI